MASRGQREAHRQAPSQHFCCLPANSQSVSLRLGAGEEAVGSGLSGPNRLLDVVGRNAHEHGVALASLARVAIRATNPCASDTSQALLPCGPRSRKAQADDDFAFVLFCPSVRLQDEGTGRSDRAARPVQPSTKAPKSAYGLFRQRRSRPCPSSVRSIPVCDSKSGSGDCGRDHSPTRPGNWLFPTTEGAYARTSPRVETVVSLSSRCPGSANREMQEAEHVAQKMAAGREGLERELWLEGHEAEVEE